MASLAPSSSSQLRLEGHVIHHVALVGVAKQPLHLRFAHHPALPWVVFLDGVLQHLVLQSNGDVLGAPPQEAASRGRVRVSCSTHVILLNAQGGASVLELTCRQRRGTSKHREVNIWRSTSGGKHRAVPRRPCVDADSPRPSTT